jgi:RNA polymerase sigma factor
MVQVVAEVVENALDLDKRALLAKQAEYEMETLLDEFKPFLYARVARYTSSYSSDQREELFSTAMLAFHEAVQGFDTGKGHFFPFANRVVCNRLIDVIRSIYRHDEKTVPLLEDTGGDQEGADKSASVRVLSTRTYAAERQREQLVDEIEQFKAELDTWGITMEMLVKSSPKHKKLRDIYKAVVAAIAGSPDIVQTIHIKRYFPVKEIFKLTKIPPKKLERGRTFILALLIIRMGDYDYLSDYISG